MRHDRRQADALHTIRPDLPDLTSMLRLARAGIARLFDLQREALGPAWPFQ